MYGVKEVISFNISFIQLEKSSILNTALKEVETLRKSNEMNCEMLVRYYQTWFDKNNAYIQMEYCFDNLNTVLQLKTETFKRNENKAMNSIEYFISCEIFRQITEALNYLHSIKPEPLIHRNLKPENILIGMSGNKRICKLADFGLSKFIEDCSASYTQFIDTRRYAAPEMVLGHRYDIKADIYSLGRIALKIFDTSNNNPNNGNFIEKIFSAKIGQKIDNWHRLILDKLIIPIRRYRISCEEILTQIRKLGIKKKSIPVIEFEFYKKIFIDKQLQYFSDILTD